MKNCYFVSDQAKMSEKAQSRKRGMSILSSFLMKIWSKRMFHLTYSKPSHNFVPHNSKPHTLFIRSVHLLNFKNYSELFAEFSPGLNCFTGLNGTGKTNLMDALYYSCFTKSYFNNSDKYAYRFESPFFKISTSIEVDNGKTHEVAVKSRLRANKEISIDGVICEKMADFVGKFLAVMVTPDDNTLILGGSTLRRKFLDGCICQLDRDYLGDLLEYKRWLKKRNTYLKTADRSAIDNTILDAYDSKLGLLANSIFEKRTEFLSKFQKPFQENYSEISESDKEVVSLIYKSDLSEQKMEDLLAQNRAKDLIVQRTSSGIHQDELQFQLNDAPLKKVGSQGQQKSFLIALKLAQYQIMVEAKQIKPVLFLDDVF